MTGNAQAIIGKVVSKYTSACARAMAWGENRWGGVARSQKRLMVSENSSRELRVFQLLRDEDPSGVSGVGRVAVGVVFPSGKVVLEWLGSHSTFGDLRRPQTCRTHSWPRRQDSDRFHERCNTGIGVIRPSRSFAKSSPC